MYHLEALQSEDFEEVWNIMEKSFPIAERRNYQGQKRVLAEPAYHLYGCRKDGTVAAFFAVWEFDEFAFVEHFAVGERLRNGGIGAELLTQLKDLLNTNIILEVEPPAGEMERRRIGFYERNGFRLNEYAYVQPPLNRESRGIPLKIMSYPNLLSVQFFEWIREELYRRVYKV